MARERVTAEDVEAAVWSAVDLLREVPPAEWNESAGELTWDRWETVEHMSDDLFSYAVQLGPRKPPLSGYLAFAAVSGRPGGPETAVRADRAAGADGLLGVLEASGALLAGMVRVTAPGVRAYHPSGLADGEGFAAMGVVETLVHTYDVTRGLEVEWAPPAGLCARALERLFPDIPREMDPWSTLLWATGRTALPGRERLTPWRWFADVRG